MSLCYQGTKRAHRPEIAVEPMKASSFKTEPEQRSFACQRSHSTPPMQGLIERQLIHMVQGTTSRHPLGEPGDGDSFMA